MRISRIYQAVPLSIHQEIDLDERSTQYLIHVLRLKANDEFHIFNGEGGEYSAELIVYDKRHYAAKILQFFPGLAESNCRITLGQAISRSDHMDIAIQKAVELGVYAIQPLITQYVSIKLDEKRLAQKQQHWQNIAISACEQSGRCKVPMVLPLIDLNQWLIQCQGTLKIILHPYLAASGYPQKAVDSIDLLIGPEGGFADSEVHLAQTHHFVGLRLGPRILRTETTTIAALALLQNQFGDLH